MTTDEHLDKIAAKCRELLVDHEGSDGIAKLAMAGWRSTLATIVIFRGIKNRHGIGPAAHKLAVDGIASILAAWPIELL